MVKGIYDGYEVMVKAGQVYCDDPDTKAMIEIAINPILNGNYHPDPYTEINELLFDGKGEMTPPPKPDPNFIY